MQNETASSGQVLQSLTYISNIITSYACLKHTEELGMLGNRFHNSQLSGTQLLTFIIRSKASLQ